METLAELSGDIEQLVAIKQRDPPTRSRFIAGLFRLLSGRRATRLMRMLIKLIRRMGNLMRNIDQSREFVDYLAELHAQFKPKRNFIKLLDGVARAHAPGSKR